MSRIVVTLGGNALGDTPHDLSVAISGAVHSLAGLVAEGHEIVVSHGNGPQVGAIKLAFQEGHAAREYIPLMDLPECTAMSQGYIGYHLQQGLSRELRAHDLPQNVVSLVTQVEVASYDPAFGHPSKPIGRCYSESEARLMTAGDPKLVMREDSGRGWRQVVPSPIPLRIVEGDSILELLDHGFIVIACGGGGVPVVKRAAGDYEGVPAVIDKDLTSAVLADSVGADCLVILTAVDKVSLNFGQPDQVDLDDLDAETAVRYARDGHFGAGSMRPKVLAAVDFVRGGPGRRSVIGSLEHALEAMDGRSGTVIHA